MLVTQLLCDSFWFSVNDKPIHAHLSITPLKAKPSRKTAQMHTLGGFNVVMRDEDASNQQGMGDGADAIINDAATHHAVTDDTPSSMPATIVASYDCWPVHVSLCGTAGYCRQSAWLFSKCRYEDASNQQGMGNGTLLCRCPT